MDTLFIKTLTKDKNLGNFACLPQAGLGFGNLDCFKF
jgi:hypothetical protein